MRDETLDALFAEFCRRQNQVAIDVFRDRATEIEKNVETMIEEMTKIVAENRYQWVDTGQVNPFGEPIVVWGRKLGRRANQRRLRLLRSMFLNT